MTQTLLGNPFTLEVLIFFAMALVGGVIVLEPDAALGWSLASGAIVGALAGELSVSVGCCWPCRSPSALR